MHLGLTEQYKIEAFKIVEKQERPMRKFGFTEENGEVLSPYWGTRKMKAHPSYEAAKRGDDVEAYKLVKDLVTKDFIEKVKKRFGKGVIFLPVLEWEVQGKNAIPRILAKFLAKNTGNRAEIGGITQILKAKKTGAKAIERFKARSIFWGPVEKGAKYVLVDDVVTMGGTLADLASYIEENGGKVAGIITLANASRRRYINLSEATKKLLKEKFGDELEKILGIKIQALTEPEGRYLAKFKDLSSLRRKLGYTSHD